MEVKLKYTDISFPLLVALDDEAGVVWVSNLLVRHADVERPSPRVNGSADVPQGAASTLRHLAHLPSQLMGEKLAKKHRGQPVTPPGHSGGENGWPQWARPELPPTPLEQYNPAVSTRNELLPHVPGASDKPASMPPPKQEERFPQAPPDTLDRLKGLCEAILHRSISPENAASLLQLADELNVVRLREICVGYIVRHFDTIAKSPSFQTLSKTQILLVITNR